MAQNYNTSEFYCSYKHLMHIVLNMHYMKITDHILKETSSAYWGHCRISEFSVNVILM